MDDGIAASTSALSGLTLPLQAPLICVTDAGPDAHFAFRGAAVDLGSVLGVEPPSTPNRAMGGPAATAFRLGPDEWLLLVQPGDAAAFRGRVRATATEPYSLVDISHRNAGLVLDGKAAADILNVGCPLDLDLAAFPVGMCTRTLFGKAEIVLWRLAPFTFRLEVWRSFAPYVVGLLRMAIDDVTTP